jgi:hypothetical protein
MARQTSWIAGLQQRHEEEQHRLACGPDRQPSTVSSVSQRSSRFKKHRGQYLVDSELDEKTGNIGISSFLYGLDLALGFDLIFCW